MRPSLRAITAVLCFLLLGIGCSAPSADELVGVDWQVTRIVGPDGVAHLVDQEEFRVVRFDDAGRFSVDGCNHSGGKVTIERTHLSLQFEGSTLIRCQGEAKVFDELMWRLLSARAHWTRDGDTLTVRGGDVDATLVPRQPPWPRPIDNVLLEVNDRRDGPQFRVGWSGRDRVFLSYQGRASAGKPWGNGGFEVEKYPLNGPSIGVMSAAMDGDRVLVFGDLSPRTHRVEFREAHRDPAEVEVFPIPGGRKVYAGQVALRSTGRVFALDTEGRLLGRSRVLSREAL